ncbi:MAG: hypothetical protein AB1894_07645 [Chloroflexota bacterium]
MPSAKPYVSQCTCEICRLGVEHPEQVRHHHINLLMSRLDEQQRRWFAAVLAEHYGVELRGIYLVTQITGLNDKTIRKGLKDLETDLSGGCLERVRKPGAGRFGKDRRHSVTRHENTLE